ncbi:SLC13 family permease [Ferrovibrio sp.]|uniref:SLC13 family permease n=1 Tax=Ferrovibrio sp. TaxID=1917215 RepID=UPI003D27B67F
MSSMPGAVAKPPGGAETIPAHKLWTALGVVVAALLTWVLTKQHIPQEMALTAALGVFGIGLWASGALPEYWTTLAFFLFAVLLHVAPPAVIFSGFHSTTFWLVLGGLVIGAAIRFTGLGQRIALLMARALGMRYRNIVLGIALVGLLLGFLMPSSMGRAVLLVPITMALADRMGYVEGRNGRIGMLLAACFGSHVPTFSILPSNIPNTILAGSAETLYGYTTTYGQYLLLHFPVLGLLKSAVMVVLILWLFPDRDAEAAKDEDSTALGPMTAPQWRLSVILGLSLILWITDALHHVSPAWVSLGAALVCLLPSLGLTSKRVFNEEIAFASLFFLAGVMGLGAIVAGSGLGPLLVHGFEQVAHFSHDTPFWNVSMLATVSSAIGVVTTLAGVPTIMTPMAEELARATGLPLASVLMSQVLGFSNILVPYQSPPLLLSTQLGRVPMAAATKLCLWLFAISSVVLIPLDLLWWRLLGWL